MLKSPIGNQQIWKKIDFGPISNEKLPTNHFITPKYDKPKMSSDQVSFIDIDFILYYVQHLTLTLNFAVRSIMTKYQMFQDV